MLKDEKTAHSRAVFCIDQARLFLNFSLNFSLNLSLHIKALVHKSLDAFNISDICIAMDRVLHNRGSNGKVDNISWLIIVHESINKAG